MHRCGRISTGWAVLPDRALLFIDPAKLDAQVRAHLDRLGVEVLPYEAAQETVEQVLSGKRVLLMPERVGYAFYLRLEAAKAQIIEGENPSILRKSVKNAVQLEHLRQAHQKDGVAVTKLLCWLKTGMEGGHPTEAQIAEKLDTLRLGQEGCLGPSFITISGFGAHGEEVGEKRGGRYSGQPQQGAGAAAVRPGHPAGGAEGGQGAGRPFPDL